ncbi:hypothetical protein GCM10025867_25470 [Frondihabitans sucicola]|uniref:Uncharacterized protein n=1 Tax=Frondihabitans sucicola TaxID=1268041 RepID=A0ABM8GPC5_9MICO|nr:hypothetical protein [Frondihabitans sucicola]BDZ50306.1 hypothetical protein GCM10025867_25470 [Frondihabitans sucicola]
MTLADLPWIFSDQRPHGVLTYDHDDVDWVDAEGKSPLGAVQDVVVGAEFEVSFVVPGNVEPTSDLLDSALPDLNLLLAYEFGGAPSELIVTPSVESSENDITASWSGDGPVALDGFADAAAELKWTDEQATEVERWIGSTVDLARRLQSHIELTAERIEDDIAHGFTVSMPFGDNENIDGGYIATFLLPTDTEDDELDPDAVNDLGLDGARAWAAVSTHFPAQFVMEACGYFGFDVVE